MHPTPLRGLKIVRILKAGFSSTAFSIYQRGAGDGQAVGQLGGIMDEKVSLSQKLGLITKHWRPKAKGRRRAKRPEHQAGEVPRHVRLASP